jgi:hypothetical protein
VTVDLNPAAVEAIARRVAELLADERPGDSPEVLVSATEIARRFGVSRDTVYAKADEWGAVRLGTGPKARLRFDPQVVAERLGKGSGDSPEPIHEPRRRRPGRRPAATADLLPIRGRA